MKKNRINTTWKIGLFFTLCFFAFSCDMNKDKIAYDFLSVFSESEVLNQPEDEKTLKFANSVGSYSDIKYIFLENKLAGKSLTLLSIETSSEEFEILGKSGEELTLPVEIKSKVRFPVLVRILPESEGAREAELTIKFLIGKDEFVQTLKISADPANLIGGRNNTGLKLVNFDDAFYSFQEVSVGSSSKFSLTVENISKNLERVTIYNYAFSNRAFSLSEDISNKVLFFGETFLTEVVFAPDSELYYNDSLLLYTSNGLVEIGMRGLGTLSSSAVLSFSVNNQNLKNNSSYTFSDVVVGDQGEVVNFEIKNNGIEDLVIEEISNSFPLAISGVSLPLTLRNGNTYNFSASFKPLSWGNLSNFLLIRYNGGKLFTLNLKGYGIMPDSSRVRAFDEDNLLVEMYDLELFSAVPIDSSSKRVFTVKNLGDRSLLVDSVLSSSFSYSCSYLDSNGDNISLPITLEKNEFFFVEVNFSPRKLGLHLGEISITSDDSDNSIYLFNLEGYCIDVLPLLPPVFLSSNRSLDSRTPEWRWETSEGSSGIGQFRYKFEDSDIEKDAIESSATSYVPDLPLEDGEYSLYLQEKDLFGNWSPVTEQKIVVSLTPPAAPLLSVVFDDEEKSLVINSRPTVSWEPFSQEGIQRYRCSFNNGIDWQVVENKSCLPSAALADGAHVVKVQSQDIFGRWGDSATAVIVVDTQGPNIALAEIAAGRMEQILYKAETFDFSLFERGADSVADDNYGDCSGTLTIDYSDIDINAEGEYSVKYSAVDPMGNISEKIRKIYVIDFDNLEFEWSIDEEIWEDSSVLLENSTFKIRGGDTFFLQIKPGTIPFLLKEQLSLTWSVGSDGDFSGNIVNFAENSFRQEFVIDYDHSNPEAVEKKVIKLEVVLLDKTGTPVAPRITLTEKILPIWPKIIE
ncbi:MAG: choice-of-anchor D domain-containing protein [Spirochaetales bacterium]|nr:choice-of-anchor D domain-containing protein [Spirochaetales bacterium]